MPDDDPPLPFLRKAGQWLVYAVFRVVESLLRLLPFGLAARAGRLGGWLAWFTFRGYRRLVLRNLRIAFGSEMTDRERRRLAHTHFVTLGGNLLCSLKIPWLSQEKMREFVDIEGLKHVTAAQIKGRGLIFAICHTGNWELLAQLHFTSAMRPGAMYQRLGNRFLNAHVERLRARAGCTLFDRRSGFSGPSAWLRKNNAVGILVDQHAGDAGVWCPMFGRLASTTNLAALLAKRTGAVILPLTVSTTGPARWKMHIGAPLPGAGEGLSPDEAAAEMNLALEQMIRHSPADWFWMHNRWKTPDPDFLIANYRRGMVLPRGWTADRLQRFEIVIRSPNWLGDACMAMPAVRAIRRGRPDCRVTILTPAKLADVWKMLPEADDVIAVPSGKGVPGVRALLKQKGRAWDAAVLLPNSVRTALEVYIAGVPRIVGYRGHRRSWLMHQIVPPRKRPGPIEHHSLHYLRLARRLGADVNDSTLFAPVAPAPLPSARSAEYRLQLGLCPGAEYGPAKRWPAERFAEAAQLVLGRVECHWLLFGAAGDAGIGRNVAERLGDAVCTNLIGQTSLAQLCQRLRECRLLLTNDTGTMHLAALLGVPVVAVFGSTEPAWTGPLGGRAAGHTVIRNHVPCSPCFLRECPIDFRCMTSVEPARVAEAVIRECLRDA